MVRIVRHFILLHHNELAKLALPHIVNPYNHLHNRILKQSQPLKLLKKAIRALNKFQGNRDKSVHLNGLKLLFPSSTNSLHDQYISLSVGSKHGLSCFVDWDFAYLSVHDIWLSV